MMKTQELCRVIIDENLKLLAHVQTEEIEVFMQGLDQAENIFCAAQGRSGYILRCFCMRLTHLGCRAYFAGETVTPRIKSGDILVVLSGSGRTAYTVELIKLAKRARAATYGVIGTKDSPMGRNLDHVVCLPVPSQNSRSWIMLFVFLCHHKIADHPVRILLFKYWTHCLNKPPLFC
ncbi:MAG: SIS domain-containing protein [Deltaproteobacteria bacterium]|nr:SIS domain-containing protein [Deltaproteobacteria bacterium]